MPNDITSLSNKKADSVWNQFFFVAFHVYIISKTFNDKNIILLGLIS